MEQDFDPEISDVNVSLNAEDFVGQVDVSLEKSKDSNLGLIVSSSADRGGLPLISGLRPGSIADRSDCLLINDVIKAINGIDSSSLTHAEIIQITRCSEPTIHLTLEYVQTKTAENEKEDQMLFCSS
ncbi:Glutamate receptor-interacting protein 1 [Sparganum proliferum]